MAGRKQMTADAVKILHRRYIKGSKKRLESLRNRRDNLEVAEQIYNLRTQARLTQKELAKLVGTTQSVISRLEDADYNGHSLAMLRKIGAALHKKLQLRFVPDHSECAYA
jgi:DNA-binding XRE family transcriptional regulator